MTAYDDLVLLAAPAAYWKLDEASGVTLHDASGNGHDLTVASSAAFDKYRVPGPSDENIPFAIDWANTQAAVAASGALGQFAAGHDFSLEGWMAGIAGGGLVGEGMVTKGYNAVEQRPWWSLGFTANGAPFVWLRNVAGADFKLNGFGNVSDATFQNRGPFHYIAAVYTHADTTMLLYQDGQLAGQMTVPDTGWGTGAQALALNVLDGTIGGQWQAATAIYNYALSPADIAARASAGIQGQAGGLPPGAQQILEDILRAVRRTFPATS